MSAVVSTDVEANLDDYIRRVLRPHPFFAEPPGDGHFFSRCRQALVATLRRLDALDRADPLWHNTNLRATVHKLHDFIPRLLAENPADEEALWCRVALHHLGGSGEFGRDEWRALAAAGRLDVRWPVESAFYVYAFLGDRPAYRRHTSRELADLLRELGLCRAAEPVLAGLTDRERYPLSPWRAYLRPRRWIARVHRWCER